MYWNLLMGVIDNASSSSGSGSVVDTWNYKNLFILTIFVSLFLLLIQFCLLKYKEWKIEKLEEENKELQKEIKELTKKE